MSDASRPWWARSPALFAKRAFDLGVAGGALVVLGPGLAALTALVWRRHGWPPVFVQERPGHEGRIFRLVKLRTMTDERGADGALLPDEERMTAFGRALRASSLDELPELLNVLRGDMSLVGPRPLLVRYLDRYSPEQARRHEMPPGITGWAAVNGRNALDWDDKLALDVWYVDHWSLALDAKVLWKTARTVLLREGIAAEGAATMPEFMGSAAAPAATANGAPS